MYFLTLSLSPFAVQFLETLLQLLRIIKFTSTGRETNGRSVFLWREVNSETSCCLLACLFDRQKEERASRASRLVAKLQTEIVSRGSYRFDDGLGSPKSTLLLLLVLLFCE